MGILLGDLTGKSIGQSAVVASDRGLANPIRRSIHFTSEITKAKTPDKLTFLLW